MNVKPLEIGSLYWYYDGDASLAPTMLLVPLNARKSFNDCIDYETLCLWSGTHFQPEGVFYWYYNGSDCLWIPVDQKKNP